MHGPLRLCRTVCCSRTRPTAQFTAHAHGRPDATRSCTALVGGAAEFHIHFPHLPAAACTALHLPPHCWPALDSRVHNARDSVLAAISRCVAVLMRSESARHDTGAETALPVVQVRRRGNPAPALVLTVVLGGQLLAAIMAKHPKNVALQALATSVLELVMYPCAAMPRGFSQQRAHNPLRARTHAVVHWLLDRMLSLQSKHSHHRTAAARELVHLLHGTLLAAGLVPTEDGVKRAGSSDSRATVSSEASESKHTAPSQAPRALLCDSCALHALVPLAVVPLHRPTAADVLCAKEVERILRALVRHAARNAQCPYC